MKPYDIQECRYCGEHAQLSLTYGEAADYVPVCWGHIAKGRAEVRKLGYGVKDQVGIDNRITPWLDDKLIRALQPAPSYPRPTSESRYGLRVDAKRARGAVSEADAVPPPSLRQQRKERLGFLQTLGTEWRNLKAFRNNSGRITVSIDDQKFTLYTRRG